ncbi:hypothetical protein [Adhaeribacter radiodurans]|uniref:O-antigen polysaccharide polymerase Wzy n=1 Tax=Adhaeribacter radiodurans TaxID=2745197 RepID=A0A7L7L3S7_9BACT|nr:hypothetical protein [Adhaeribacter radiodurans]QMU27430.1 hypothetical protein HUW48_04980 [Adhaeribacter radiodurans]
MNFINQNQQSLLLVRKALLILAAFTFAAQLLVDASEENLFSNLFALGAFVLTCFLIFHPRNSQMGTAFTSTTVFFIITANSLAPMLGTLLEGHPLTHTLLQPKETYFHRFIFALVLLVAQALAGLKFFLPMRYGMSQLGSVFKSRTFLPPAGVWGLGAIGFLAYLVKYLHLPNVIIKLLDGFGFLLWAPFLLLLSPYSAYFSKPSVKWKIFIYYILQVGVSLAGNSRMGMVGPVAMVGAAWVVTLLLGRIKVNKKLIMRGITLGVTGLFLAGQFADLSTAILIERAQRSTRGKSEQLAATWERFLDKEALVNYRNEYLLLLSEGKADEEWQENYVVNDFIGRFIQIKYDDNCFNRILGFDDADIGTLKETSKNLIIATLPEPFLQPLGFNIDKEFLNSFSTGDLIEAISGRGDLGGFRVGSIPAHAYALFGWLYPLILVLIYCIIFILFQGLFSFYGSRLKTWYGVSTLGLLIVFTIFVNISTDGISTPIGMILRASWQIMIIYHLALWFVSRIGKVPIDSSDKQFPSKTDHNNLSIPSSVISSNRNIAQNHTPKF